MTVMQVDYKKQLEKTAKLMILIHRVDTYLKDDSKSPAYRARQPVAL
jgi:hypothetical protein